MTAVTAKIIVTSKGVSEYGTNLAFGADYADGRNNEWAVATPSISVSMSVNNEVGALFEQGKPWTVTFTPTED
jgi:hypothetical protein